MFAPKTAILLAVLATAAPVLSYNPYAEEDGLYAREFDDLYIREADDLDFEMQKREIIDNYLVARDDLESLLSIRAPKNSGVIGAERTALKDHSITQKAKGKEAGLQNKIKSEEKALKKTEHAAKAEKGTIRKDEHRGSQAQHRVKQDLSGGKPKGKGKRSLFDDLSFEW